MAVTNYATMDEFKNWLGIDDISDDSNMEVCITAASRWIDNHCKQRFYLDTTATARTFAAVNSHLVNIDPLGSTTGLTVKVDQDGDGTFETTLTASDYLLLPDDAADLSRPYTTVQAVGSQPFPLNTLRSNPDERVEVTGRWGFPAVPPEVNLACLIYAHRLFTRRKSPEGVAGFNDFGVVRLRRVDDDVIDLLHDLTLVGVW